MAGKRQLYLTEGQKDCLRLVDDLLTSKEIARKLGISPFTVDQRLDAARRKLNATSRKSAARIYLEMESRSLPQPIVYDAPDIADFDFVSMLYVEKGREAAQPVNRFSKNHDSQSGEDSKPMHGAKSYSAVLKALMETGLISVIMVSAMTLILSGLLHALR